MNSAYYYNLIIKYQDIRDRLTYRLADFDSTINKLMLANLFFLNQDSLTMTGEQVDKGKISESITNIQMAKANIENIIAECAAEIEENYSLYNQALAREAAAKEEAESDG